jgi:hypothetical protein
MPDSSVKYTDGPPCARGCILDFGNARSLFCGGENAGAQRSVVGGSPAMSPGDPMHGWRSSDMVTTSVLLSGCAVGPEFQSAPLRSNLCRRRRFHSRAQSGLSSNFYVGLISSAMVGTISLRPLNSVVARAIDRNPDLAAAQAAADCQCQHASGARRLLPQVGASIGLLHRRNQT